MMRLFPVKSSLINAREFASCSFLVHPLNFLLWNTMLLGSVTIETDVTVCPYQQPVASSYFSLGSSGSLQQWLPVHVKPAAVHPAWLLSKSSTKVFWAVQ